MKLFLMVYPIKRYIDWELENCSYPNRNPQVIMDRFNELIQIRYRKMGFQIAWLLPSINDREFQLSEHVLISEEDIKLFSKIQFVGEEIIHINPEDIDLFKSFSEIKLGGFHLADCVENVKTHYNLKLVAMLRWILI